MIITPSNIKQLYAQGRTFNKPPIHRWKMNEISGLVLWSKLDGANSSGIDKSIVGPDGVWLNNLYVSYNSTYAKFGSCALFDVNYAACIQYAGVATLIKDYGCIEFWFRPSFNYDDGYENYSIFHTDPYDSSYPKNLYYDSTNQFFHFTAGTASAMTVPGSHVAGTWMHIALCWSKNGIEGTTDTARVYMNGAFQVATTSAYTTSLSTALHIGNQAQDNEYAYGMVDNLKVWNYPKTDFSDRHVEAPSYTGVIDYGTKGINGTNRKALCGYGGVQGNTSYYFNGSGYIDLGDVCNFERTDKFSLSFWLKHPGPTSGIYQAILCKKNSADPYPGWGVLIEDTRFILSLTNNYASSIIYATYDNSTTIMNNQWNHIVWTYNGNSNLSGVKLMLNGVSKTLTGTNTLSGSIRTDKKFNIGAQNSGTNYFLTGYIQDLQVFDRVLSPRESLELYERGFIE